MSFCRQLQSKYRFLLAILAGVFLFVPAIAKAESYWKPSLRYNYQYTTTYSSTVNQISLPNGGETWEAGQNYNINYTYAAGNSVDAVSLYLQTYGVTAEQLIAYRITVDTQTGTGSYLWTIPQDLGDKYQSFKIIVRAYKNGSEVGNDTSDNYFSIVPLGQTAAVPLAANLNSSELKLKIIIPSGAENLKIGDAVTIKWQSQNLSAINIGYTTGVDQPVEWILKNYVVHPNQKRGSWRWTVPSGAWPNVYYKLYLFGERAGVGAATSYSDDFFTVTLDGSGKLGADLEQPGNTTSGEKLTLNWSQSNVETVNLYYTAYPAGLASQWQAIVQNYTVNADQRGTYQWQVPANLPAGYYAIRLDSYRGNNQLKSFYSPNYGWIGPGAEDQKIMPLVRPDALAINLSAEIIPVNVVKISWLSPADLVGQKLTLDYGRTLNYGRTLPVTIYDTAGSTTLEKLIPGYTYHYRFRGTSQTTADAQFLMPGAVDRLGYYITNSTDNSLAVKLTWESNWDQFDVYFCQSNCGVNSLSSWTKVESALADYGWLGSNSLFKNQSAYYQIVPADIADGFLSGAGERVLVTNPGNLITVVPSRREPTRIINDKKIFEKYKGKILLRSETDGAAFYLNPRTRYLTYLGRPAEGYVIFREQAVGATNADLAKIPVGLGFSTGVDSDKDGLPDTLEEALGTNELREDTDGDGYTDRLELKNNYSPILPFIKSSINRDLVRRVGGQILLQAEGRGQMWYVNPADGRRYLITEPADVLRLWQRFGVGVTGKSWVAFK
ncbi:MAG TPA: hypothetical protein DDX47_01715 [Candidatus Jacksonbacteria bacterium]|nr:MAG: Calcium-binding acidic-repeat protein (ARP) [Parcubacteria group bacterium GW2011_GWC2_44_22]OGY75475.1 MAG: hypothetical protein A2240_03095 [Candidatus Jacksonbacteria bacterium RIFOXYA2_FULL_43_12]OGY79130.1 MAG: hypothetical protein A2550_01465 [Candidatus Jacksonbacteria bacterium RIFOXYD2_FULL_43_21]HBH46065.1 hypothetical protein [Candidatus Jacksonbacteria bacterium]HCC49675.1 hypothetical protein [Candidatus Jacksonbacteria bacterium]